MCGMDVRLNKLETLTLQTALRVPCQTNSQRWLILFKVHIHSVNNVLNQSYVKELFKPKPQCFLEPNQAVLSPKWQRSVLHLVRLAAVVHDYSVSKLIELNWFACDRKWNTFPLFIHLFMYFYIRLTEQLIDEWIKQSIVKIIISH